MELIFAPITKAEDETGDKSESKEGKEGETALQSVVNPTVEGLIVVTDNDAEAYDQMLHEESKFWEEIAQKKRQRKRDRAKAMEERSQQRKEEESKGPQFAIDEDSSTFPSVDDESEWRGVENPPPAGEEPGGLDDTVAASMALLAEIDELEEQEKSSGVSWAREKGKDESDGEKVKEGGEKREGKSTGIGSGSGEEARSGEGGGGEPGHQDSESPDYSHQKDLEELEELENFLQGISSSKSP